MTDEAKINQAAEFALGDANAPITDLRIGALTPHLAVVDDEVRVVDANGSVRTTVDPVAGVRPLTIIELMRETLASQTSDESRALRWKPYPWTPA